VIEFKDKLEERLFVTKSNLEGKGRHLNNFRRTELALKSKPDLKEIAHRNESLGGKKKGGKSKGKGGGSLTPLGRVDDEIARMANVSRDTVSKVEKIIDSMDNAEDLEELRSEAVSINQAYNLILDQERLEEIYEAIEPLRPQIEGIIKEWAEFGEHLFQQFFQHVSEMGPNISTQQKEEVSTKFAEYGIHEYYMKIVSGVFNKLRTNKQLDPKEEMSKALESIQRIKIAAIERREKRK
jgi:hypothetical protein